jgi:predicted nucleic acid-binding protein
MNESGKPVVFIDSNVLIEALIESEPALAVLDLAIIEAINLVTCQLVVADVEDEIVGQHASAPRQIDAVVETWRVMLERTKLKVHPDPALDTVLEAREKFLPTMRHLADIPVLAAAIEAKANFIVSGNRKHFNDAIAARAGIPIYSCTEFLANLVEPRATPDT